jgi:hypothetical protein
MAKVNKSCKLGEDWAKNCIAVSEFFYNRDTQRRVLTAMRNELTRYIKKIPPSSRGKKIADSD